jgi:hypothetical protein
LLFHLLRKLIGQRLESIHLSTRESHAENHALEIIERNGIALSMSETGITWRKFWTAKPLRHMAIGTISGLLVLAILLPNYFQWIDAREGAVLNDPLLEAIGPQDCSLPMFIVLYGMLVLTVYSLRKSPVVLFKTLLAYLIMVGLRLIAMALVPLEPPAGILPLLDPISQFFYPSAEPFQKDLFFSGHLATALLLTFPVRGALRWIHSAGCVLIAIMLLLQHVHYTVDLLTAPFAAIIAWKISGRSIDRLQATRRF